jgi:hypothetical protein
MELRLYEMAVVGHDLDPDTNEMVEQWSPTQLLVQTEMTTSPGVMHATWPEALPELEPGNRYLWKVVVLCDPNRPSDSLLAEAEMEVVAPPTDLETTLAQTTSPLDRANIYAAAGLWYDALAQVIDGQSPEAVAYRQALLEELAVLEGDSPLSQVLSEPGQSSP